MKFVVFTVLSRGKGGLRSLDHYRKESHSINSEDCQGTSEDVLTICRQILVYLTFRTRLEN